MHINLQLLECVYMIVAMLLEIPNIAENQYLVNNNSMTGQLITMTDLESYSEFKRDYLIVAGGAKTYIKLLPYITEFYVTHINGNYDGDTFMPEFEHTFTHKEVVKEFDLHKVIMYTK